MLPTENSIGRIIRNKNVEFRLVTDGNRYSIQGKIGEDAWLHLQDLYSFSYQVGFLWNILRVFLVVSGPYKYKWAAKLALSYLRKQEASRRTEANAIWETTKD